MSVRMLGAEFKRFYADPEIWGEDTFHEDVLILVDGSNATDSGIDLSEVSDSAIVEIKCGDIVEGLPGVPDDIADAAIWWRGRQDSVQYAVMVPKSKVAAFEEAMAGIDLKDAVVLL